MEIAAEVWSWVGPKATGTARFGGEPRRHGACIKGSYPLVRGESCPACAEVTGIGRDTREGYFVTDLVVSRLRLQREQHVPGWCVLLLRRHAREPHELPEAERVAFFEDMVRVGRALELVYG